MLGDRFGVVAGDMLAFQEAEGGALGGADFGCVRTTGGEGAAGGWGQRRGKLAADGD